MYSRIEFGTRFETARWDEEAAQWVVTLTGPNGTEERRFHAVISALGQLDRPHVPDFPGLATFAGIAVHSQDWDETVDTAGKRVVVTTQVDPSIIGGDVWFCSDEHVTFAPAEPVAVGDRVRIVPAHIDPTVSMHEAAWITSGGEVIDRWPIDLRGW